MCNSPHFLPQAPSAVCAVLSTVLQPGNSTHRGTGGAQDPTPGGVPIPATSLQGGDRTQRAQLSLSVKILTENHSFGRSLLSLPGTFAQAGLQPPWQPDRVLTVPRQQQGLGSVCSPAQHPQGLAEAALPAELSSAGFPGGMILSLSLPRPPALLPPCRELNPLFLLSP